LIASVEVALTRPAATLTRRLGLADVPNETPWLALLPAKVGVTPPTLKPALARMARLAISTDPNAAPAPMATLSFPDAEAPVPMAMVSS
jgi:hypothetical protein